MSLFPLTSNQWKQLHQGEPHESFSEKHGCQACKECGKLLGKKVLWFPLEVPFFIVSNVVLIIGKMGEIAYRVLVLCGGSTAKKRNKIKAVALQFTDYIFLLPVYSIVKILEILKLFFATCGNPKLHFKHPDKVSLEQQEKFYEGYAQRTFEKLHNSKKYNLQTKASLHELQIGVQTLKNALTKQTDRISLLKEIFQKLEQLKGDVSKEKFIDFRNHLMRWANLHSIPLSIRLPLVDER